MKNYEIGRCTIQVELNEKGISPSKLNKYDVVLFDTKESKVIRDIIGILKFDEDSALKSVEKTYNFEQTARRYTILKDRLDMCYHNLMCYSTNLLMDTPKPEWSNEWHEALAEIKTIESWLDDTEFNNEKWHGRI